MRRGSRWLAIGLAIGLAAVGAIVAYVLGGGRWAALGVAIGAVTGSFTPSVPEWIIGRAGRRDELHSVFENSPPRSPARLLDPRRELVDFVGREDELAKLVTWCQNDQVARVRLVTGPGGVGKTRLAVEVSDRMRKRGWRAERIADGKEPDAIAALRSVTRSRALLVVDYAETRTGLKEMLSALASDQGKRVRVLLLARAAGDWWDQLGVGEPAAWDQVQAARSAQLELSPQITSELSDAGVVALAVRSFAGELDLPEKTVEIYGGSGRRRVLDLHAAALLAVLSESNATTVQVDIGQVLGELLRHEQHFWYDSARAYGLRDGQDGTTTEELRQLVAAGCLLGAVSSAEARALPARVPGMSPSGKIGGWLRYLYPPDPGESEWIGSVQPDRLAELHTLNELTASSELAQACLADLDAKQALRAVTLLARASSDYPQAEILLGRTLPSVASLITGMQVPVETLMAIFNAIPYPTVILASAAATLCQRVLAILPTDTEPAVRAQWLANVGVRFSALGRPADALLAEQEAVSIRRDLAAANPDRHNPDLAQSLNNLSVTFSELGRPADALPLTLEAVTIRRDLAAANPDRHNPDLAESLNNLGVRFSALGRPADALHVTQEAVAIRRDLAAVNPDRYNPGLARSLNNLGAWFAEMGRPADALPVTQEAVAVRRDLTAVNSDRYNPDLAFSLNSLGIRFSQLGRPAEALPVTREAVAIRRDLAAANPDRYNPRLASSLNSLGMRLAELGRPAEALPVTREAVAIRRDLAAANPDLYNPCLASSLNSLGIRLSELGRPADALPVAQEAVTAYRELAAANPDRYNPDLASALTNLGDIMEALGCQLEADAAREEATKLRGQLGQ
jgi:tetratricopeptide (TPR) repeat protein